MYTSFTQCDVLAIFLYMYYLFKCILWAINGDSENSKKKKKEKKINCREWSQSSFRSPLISRFSYVKGEFILERYKFGF